MTTKLDNAVADMKRQLRTESKSALIKQWIGLYVQVTQLLIENDKLKKELEALKPKAEQESSEEVKND